MVEASEIRDAATLNAWLEARPEATRRRDAVMITHRAAMRVLPNWIAALDEDWAQKDDLTALPILRCDLTSGVDSYDSTPEVRHAGNAAATSAIDTAATSAADTADPNAYAAALCAYDAATRATATAATSGYSLIGRDAAQAAEAITTPLWHGPLSGWAEVKLQSARDWLRRTPGHNFWLRWYDAALEGRPLTGGWDSHWELLTEIALIPDADWEQSAEHVAGLIAEIELRFLGNRPLGEDAIELGEDGLWHKAPAPPVNGSVLRDSVERVLDIVTEIETEIAAGQGNLFTALDRDLRRLRDHITRYPDRPLRLHDTFLIVQSHIARNLQSGELPEDDLVHDLSTELGIAALDLRNSHPEAHEVIKARMAHRLGRLDETQQKVLITLSEVAARHSDAGLGPEFPEDAETILSDEAGESEKLTAAWRLTGRLARMLSQSQKMVSDVSEALIWLGGIAGGTGTVYLIVKLFMTLLL